MAPSELSASPDELKPEQEQEQEQDNEQEREQPQLEQQAGQQTGDTQASEEPQFIRARVANACDGCKARKGDLPLYFHPFSHEPFFLCTTLNQRVNRVTCHQSNAMASCLAVIAHGVSGLTRANIHRPSSDAIHGLGTTPETKRGHLVCSHHHHLVRPRGKGPPRLYHWPLIMIAVEASICMLNRFLSSLYHRRHIRHPMATTPPMASRPIHTRRL